MINPSFNFCPEISIFLKTNFPQFDINYIAHARVYRDGSTYLITLDPQWAIDHCITHKRPPAGIINFDEIEGKTLLYATENCDQILGWTAGAYLYARARFKIKNLLTIMVKKDDYIDQYMIDLHNNNAIDIYFNQLPTIENIFKHLKHQFNDLINYNAKHPFIADKKFLTMRTINQQSPQISEGNFLLCNNAQYIKLSRQEHNCLKNLAKGVRQKGIAKKLNISPRTVETHLNRIRNKLGLDTADLISCYWQNQEISS